MASVKTEIIFVRCDKLAWSLEQAGKITCTGARRDQPVTCFLVPDPVETINGVPMYFIHVFVALETKVDSSTQ